MNKTIAWIFLSGLGFSLPAQTVNVRGKISNASGQAVGNAIAELLGQGLKDTTAADGLYSLTRSNTAVRSNLPSESMSFAHGVLRFVLTKPEPVSVEVFDLKGNPFRTEAFPLAAAGVYQWNFAQKTLSNQMVLIKASLGGNVRTFHYTTLEEGGASDNRFFPAGYSPAAPYLAKVAATVDTLKLSASGYITKMIPLATLDTTVNTTLDSLPTSGRSAGCGKTSWPSSASYTINVNYNNQTKSRSYILRIPTTYSASHPYRLILAFHWSGGTADNVANGSGATTKPFYGLQELAKDSTIFVAPQGINPPNGWADSGGPGDPHDGPTNTASTGGQDLAFAKALVNDLKSKLCIDTTRIFAEGFSMGGSMSYALACGAPEIFRGVAVHSGGPMSGCVKLNRKPVAYFMTHGTTDGTCTYPGYGVPEVNDFAQVNGCQAMDIAGTLKPTDQSGMNPKCADFQGCSTGHPTRACIFVGPHTPIPGGASTWVPAETWKFITQF